MHTGIDPSRAFMPLRLAILTVSDTRTEEEDTSGRQLVERAEKAGHQVVTKRFGHREASRRR